MGIKIISGGSGKINNPDSENMVKFAVQLINRSRTMIQNGSTIDERIAILHLDHGTELLMKAYLLKEGYIINKINQNKFRNGIKRDSTISEYIFKDKTMDFVDVFNIVSEKVDLSKNTKKIITEFHNLRNEIQHRALEIPLDKFERIEKFRPQLRELYEKMFPELCTVGERIPSGERVTLYDRKILF